jgi:mono/diheme cytochrome c family protein
MTSLRSLIPLVLCLAVTACSSVEDQHRQAVVRGQAIAEKWCSECHRISTDQPSGSRAGHILPPPVNAPSFMEIADRPNIDREYLSDLAHEFYTPMPTFRLPKNEQEDVMTYILSLKGQL